MCVYVLRWESNLEDESEEETESLIRCNNFALTVDIFLLLGGEDFREILSTLAVRRCGQKNSTQLLHFQGEPGNEAIVTYTQCSANLVASYHRDVSNSLSSILHHFSGKRHPEYKEFVPKLLHIHGTVKLKFFTTADTKQSHSPTSSTSIGSTLTSEGDRATLGSSRILLL